MKSIVKYQATSAQGVSHDHEEKWEENFTAAEDSVKKFKSMVQLKGMLCKRQPSVSSDGAKKPSWAEGNVDFPEGKMVAKRKEKIEQLKIET